MAASAESRFFTAADGLRLHMRDFGPRNADRLPVVCLPGLARTAADFDALAQALLAAAPRRIVALDYRGRGLSDRDRDWRNYDLMVENADIRAVLTAAGVDSAIFVGTSRGGLHVMLLAATQPRLLAAAILNDIGPVIESKGLARIRGYVGKLPTPRSWADAIDLFKRLSSAQFTAVDAATWEQFARLTFQETEVGFVPRYDPALMKTLAALDLDAPLPQLWPQFDGLRDIPLLALRGENSDLLAPATLAEMARRHPRCETYTVAGQGHAPLLLDDASLGRIVDFIRGTAL